MKRPSRVPLIAGILLIALGWAAIFLGWQRAARLDLETGQLPFLLSGGAGGIGLLLLGAIGIVVDVVQQARYRQERVLEAMLDAIGEVSRAVETLAQAVARPEPEVAHLEQRSPARRRRSTARER